MEQSEVELVEDIEEQEEIEEELTPSKVSQAVVYSTDWTVETILSQLKRKNIDMPEFQRRDAWTRPRKSRFIESVILGLPIPQIVLAEMKGQRGKYIVLDGKQRLVTLQQFIGADEGSKNNNFRLKSVDVLVNLKGYTFSDIVNDPTLQDMLTSFNNHTIRSVVIRNWPSPAFLHMLFVRFNTGSLQLSPQELRQALFPGAFVRYVDEASRASDALKVLLKSEEPDFRMRDIELLVRYLAFAFFISEHPGNLKKFLDDTCDKLNNAWLKEESKIRNQVATFENAVKAAIEIFEPEYVGRKWTEDGFGARLNKAILDVITFYFSDERIRKTALENAPEVREAFKTLCLESGDFRNSIETTTKSRGATSTRLSLWGDRLKGTLGLDFQIPTYEDNRIKFSGFW